MKIMMIQHHKNLLILSLLLTTFKASALTYRCEHQSSQNAVQSPLQGHFYIEYDKEVTFHSYKVYGFNSNRPNNLPNFTLEYSKGVTLETKFDEKKILVTNWSDFIRKFSDFKKLLEETLSPKDLDLELNQDLNLDFVTKMNRLDIYHSLILIPKDKASARKNDEIGFRFIKAGSEIEKITTLPGNKLDYQVANKNIMFNKLSGMLIQVESKINSAFLKNVFICRSWDDKKIPQNFSSKGFKKESRDIDQYFLDKTNPDQTKGQFAVTLYDLIFRILAYQIKLAPEKMQQTNLKITHALIKSKVIKDFFEYLNIENTNQGKISEEIKNQLLSYSYNHLPQEYSHLGTDELADIYKNMHAILLSYSQLMKKGYK